MSEEEHTKSAHNPDEVIVEDKKTSSGTSSDNDKVLAAVATIFPVGLIIYYAMKDCSAYVKNYAAQGTVVWGLSIITSIVFMVIGAIPVVGIIACLSPFVSLVFLVAWVMLLVKALQEDKTYQLPVVGDLTKSIFK